MSRGVGQNRAAGPRGGRTGLSTARLIEVLNLLASLRDLLRRLRHRRMMIETLRACKSGRADGD